MYPATSAGYRYQNHNNFQVGILDSIRNGNVPLGRKGTPLFHDSRYFFVIVVTKRFAYTYRSNAVVRPLIEKLTP
jgi:hypothetical protein